MLRVIVNTWILIYCEQKSMELKRMERNLIGIWGNIRNLSGAAARTGNFKE